MAFLKFAISIVLGGGIGYSLLQIVSPNESEIIKVIEKNLYNHIIIEINYQV